MTALTEVTIKWDEDDFEKRALDLHEFFTREEMVKTLRQAKGPQRYIKAAIHRATPDYTTVEYGDLYKKTYVQMCLEDLRQYFNRGHFPEGTRCQVKVFQDPLDGVVKSLHCNGPSSWIIDVLYDGQTTTDAVNISHVRKIYSRGAGNAVVKPWREKDIHEQFESSINWWHSTKTHYVLKSESVFIGALIARYDGHNDHLYSEEAVVSALCELGVFDHLRWSVRVNKRRLRKYGKVALARAKTSRKEEQKRVDEYDRSCMDGFDDI